MSTYCWFYFFCLTDHKYFADILCNDTRCPSCRQNGFFVITKILVDGIF